MDTASFAIDSGYVHDLAPLTLANAICCAPRLRDAAMWIVGVVVGGDFESLVESPGFTEPLEAKAWAQRYLAEHPDLVRAGLDTLTWRLLKA
jgi:hypothetical protein